MWTEIKKEDPKDRYLEIMCRMNKRYAKTFPPERVNSVIDNKKGRFYHYLGDGFELAIGFKYSNAINRYNVVHCGVVGRIDPREAAGILVEKMKSFIGDRGETFFYGTLPKKINDELAAKTAEELRKHPELNVEDRGAGYRLTYIPPKRAE